MRRGHVPYYKIGRWVRFLEEDIHVHLKKYRVEHTNQVSRLRHSKKLEYVAGTPLGADEAPGSDKHFSDAVV